MADNAIRRALVRARYVFWISNIDVALARWRTIPLKHIAPLLGTWGDETGDLRTKGGQHECGTIACFGGWLTRMPEFNDLGLSRNSFIPKIAPISTGRQSVHPMLKVAGDRTTSRYHGDLGHALFGYTEMFESASTGEMILEGDEKRVVVARLKRLRKQHADAMRHIDHGGEIEGDDAYALKFKLIPLEMIIVAGAQS